MRTESVPHRGFKDVHLHRGLKRAVGQMRKTHRLSAYPDESLDVVVPWRNVRIPNRPIDAVAVACVCLEVEVAPPVNLASPDDRLASDLARTKPVKRLPLGREIGRASC